MRHSIRIITGLVLLYAQAAYAERVVALTPLLEEELPAENNAQEAPARTSPPVEVSPVPPPVSSVVEPAGPILAAPQDQPLLVVRFNQRRTYFANALRQAIRQAEKTRAGLFYEVVSYIPKGANRVRDERHIQDANSNVEAVVVEMQYLGVPPENISVTSRTAPHGTLAHEVRIYVH